MALAAVVSDIAVFARHYEVELDGLVRLTFVVCGDLSTAEDAVADAVVKVWSQWRKGHVVNLGAHLRRAVLNELIGYGRRRQRHRHRDVMIAVDDAIPPDDAIEDRELLSTVLRSLPVEQRVVIALRYPCDLSESETADALGLPIGTVKSRMARGMERLGVQVRR